MFQAILIALIACTPTPTPTSTLPSADVPGSASTISAVDSVSAVDSTAGTVCKNTCPTYAPSWASTCPEGQRCIEFENQCDTPISIAYQVGCNSDGTRGAPQCDCTVGPVVPLDGSMFWKIVDGDYDNCVPSWKPPCLTSGLAVLVNRDAASCTSGTRIEFTAGNKKNVYGRFDSYNLDIEKDWFSIPVEFAPDLTCAIDHANHDCRPLWCGSAQCPDAYSTPTTGGCADGRSPQVGCQDTFSKNQGYKVTLCPSGCSASGCPSCLNAPGCE